MGEPSSTPTPVAGAAQPDPEDNTCFTGCKSGRPGSPAPCIARCVGRLLEALEPFVPETAGPGCRGALQAGDEAGDDSQRGSLAGQERLHLLDLTFL